MKIFITRMIRTPPPLKEGSGKKTKKPTAHIHLHKMLFFPEFFGKILKEKNL